MEEKEKKLPKLTKKQKNAIGILYQQRNKLYDKEYFADQVWIIHTQSYIREYFGDHSEQYKYISEFRFLDPGGLTTDPKYELNKARVIRFLRESIDKIERAGLYQPPKKNFLNYMDQRSLVTWIGVIGTVVFFAGKFEEKFQHSDDKQIIKVQSDSLVFYHRWVDSLSASKPHFNSDSEVELPVLKTGHDRSKILK